MYLSVWTIFFCLSHQQKNIYIKVSFVEHAIIINKRAAASVSFCWSNVMCFIHFSILPREDGFPWGSAIEKTILPLGDIPSGYPHWHGIFVLLYRTNPNDDGMANLCNPSQLKRPMKSEFCCKNNFKMASD